MRAAAPRHAPLDRGTVAPGVPDLKYSVAVLPTIRLPAPSAKPAPPLLTATQDATALPGPREVETGAAALSDGHALDLHCARG